MTQPAQPWMNSTAAEKRSRTLLSEMTLEEKIGQLCQLAGRGEGIEERIRCGGVGSLLNVSLSDFEDLQAVAVSESRLGIPILLGRDVIHGLRTIFPIPLGQAATFDESIVELGARVAGRESAAQGIHWTFAPMVDIARDPRWGRIAESLGEDPWLASRLGAAMVRGFQTDDPSREDAIAACAKHYIGYGAAEGGRDYNTTLIPEAEMQNVYLPSFRSCVDAGVLTVMSAFNDLDGVPATGHRRLIRQVLKQDIGFRGFVVSDWGSVTEMITHGFAADAREAALKALLAGVDMEMVSTSFVDHVKDLLASKVLLLDVVDEAVLRILEVKFRLGLFEKPLRVRNDAILFCDEHRIAAREAAVRSCVLLKNRESLLPISDSRKKVALLGPLADAGDEQVGCWCPDVKAGDSVSVKSAWMGRTDWQVSFAQGLESFRSEDSSSLEEAVRLAREADVAVLCLGEGAILSGEAHSRAFLRLPGAQQALLEAVSATGTPVVVVLFSGRPLVLTEVLPHAQSVLLAWHPGSMGGPAIVDLLCGDRVPSGKLPVSFPATEGQIPVYYNKRNTGRPAPENARGIPQGTPLDPVGFCSNYLDADHLPLFPFGFGLGYSKVSYKGLELSTRQLQAPDRLHVSFELTNEGIHPVKEVAQLYIRDVAASLTRPVRELKAICHVELKPGESQRITLTLAASDLAFRDPSGRLKLEPGEFQIWIGGDSLAPLGSTFHLE